jgi:hypothetical protein
VTDHDRCAAPRAQASGRGWSVHAVLNAVFLSLFLALVLSVGSLRIEPATGRVTLPFSYAELPETCQSLTMTGRPCPSCGATRSLIAALHGEPGLALAYHRAGLPIAVMLVLQIGMRLLFLYRRSAALDVVASAGMLVVFAAVLN